MPLALVSCGIKLHRTLYSSLVVRWPDQGTPQNFGEIILLHFLIYMMVLSKNQEGVEV